MKRLSGWRWILFIVFLLTSAFWSSRWWSAWASPAVQNGTATDLALEVTPTATPMLVAQSADTGGIVVFASILLLVILGGTALGWRLTVASQPRTPASGESSAANPDQEGKAGRRRGHS